jgi:hypothetical protein
MSLVAASGPFESGSAARPGPIPAVVAFTDGLLIRIAGISAGLLLVVLPLVGLLLIGLLLITAGCGSPN